MSLKVGDIVKFYYFEHDPLYGIIVEQTPDNYPTRFSVNWFNGTIGRGPRGYRASHLIKVSDGQE